MSIYLKRYFTELLLSGRRTKTPLAVHPLRRREWVSDDVMVPTVSLEMLIKLWPTALDLKSNSWRPPTRLQILTHLLRNERQRSIHTQWLHLICGSRGVKLWVNLRNRVIVEISDCHLPPPVYSSKQLCRIMLVTLLENTALNNDSVVPMMQNGWRTCSISFATWCAASLRVAGVEHQFSLNFNNFTWNTSLKCTDGLLFDFHCPFLFREFSLSWVTLEKQSFQAFCHSKEWKSTNLLLWTLILPF